ncbi:MAG: hypothetical protein FWE72_03775, partial [Spirochaetaceae bacterium]|nr:hypothetical protein [Spirochaetaceae bacterium]
VEINEKNRTDGLYINIVLYSPKGISLNDCSKVHKTVQGRLGAHTGNRDFFIEVSSPGISRNLKSANEFSVFKGKIVKLLFANKAEWDYYKIKDSDKYSMLLEPVKKDNDSLQNSDEIKIQYSEIRKAKLES